MQSYMQLFGAVPIPMSQAIVVEGIIFLCYSSWLAIEDFRFRSVSVTAVWGYLFLLWVDALAWQNFVGILITAFGTVVIFKVPEIRGFGPADYLIPLQFWVIYCRSVRMANVMYIASIGLVAGITLVVGVAFAFRKSTKCMVPALTCLPFQFLFVVLTAVYRPELLTSYF